MKKLIRTGIVGASAALCVGAVTAGLGANAANADDSRTSDIAYAKRDEGQAGVVLVADDDDDDDDLTAGRADDTRSKNTRSKASRGTRHSRNSAKSRDNTRSNFTKVSRDGEASRGDKTRDWTRDGGDKTRDHSRFHSNDRSRNDSRR